MIIRHQLRWAVGWPRIVRMPDSRLSKQIMYSKLRNGQPWENAAMDRSAWRQNIYRGSQPFEQNIGEAEDR